MSMLKFDHDRRPYVDLERSDFRAHYENVAARKLLSVSLSIRRHWRLIASAVTLALTLAFVMLPLLPRKYSATALVYPKLFSSAHEKGVARASIEAGIVVSSEVHLLRSDAILQAVAKRLTRDSVDATSTSWAARGLERLRVLFLPETQYYSPLERTVAMLRKAVVVTNESRSYFISISFTAPSADEAARVVNAFVIEYLREKSKQGKQDVVTTAEAELARQRAINGERHPKVVQAADELGAARAALTAVGNGGSDGHDTIIAGDDVTLAIPNRRPTSPKGSVILGLALGLGLLSGVGLAVWRDRLGLEPHRRLRDVLDLRFGQHSVGGLVGRFLTFFRGATRNFVGSLHVRFPSLCRHAASRAIAYGGLGNIWRKVGIRRGASAQLWNPLTSLGARSESGKVMSESPDAARGRKRSRTRRGKPR